MKPAPPQRSWRDISSWSPSTAITKRSDAIVHMNVHKALLRCSTHPTPDRALTFQAKARMISCLPTSPSQNKAALLCWHFFITICQTWLLDFTFYQLICLPNQLFCHQEMFKSWEPRNVLKRDFVPLLYLHPVLKGLTDPGPFYLWQHFSFIVNKIRHSQ